MELMSDALEIYVDRLREGKEEKLELTLPCKLLDVQEDELRFDGKIALSGSAYLASDQLVLHLDVKADAFIPCCICNEEVSVPIDVKSYYHFQPVKEVRGGTFNITQVIREAILLEVPNLVECGGNCPQRDTLKKYFKESNKTPQEEGKNPFSDLDL